MAVNISVKTMTNKTKKRFLLPMLFSILTFAAALASIWIVHEQPDEWSSLPNYVSNPLAETIFLAALSGLCFSVTGTLLAEALHRERLRTILAASGFVIGGGLYCLCSSFSPNFDVCAGMVAAAVLLCCALITRYDRPKEALGQALACLFLCAAVAALVMLIIVLLTSAVTALFSISVSWQISNRRDATMLAVSALLVAPYLLFSFLPDQDTPREKYAGLRKVTAFVILPAYLLLLAVLLGYIVSMIVRWDFPVGRMNPYALLALCTFSALHLLLTGEENRLSKLFVRYGAWPLLPVIAAQAIAVYIRISAYGFTPSRIYGLLMTAACLIPVGAALLRRYGRVFFTVGAALVLVFAVSPMNAQTLSRYNQEARLYGALEHAQMLDETGKVIANAYASLEDRTVIWSSASYLYQQRSTLPEGSRSSELIRQLDATIQEDGKHYSFSTKAQQLFGFDDPNRKWYQETWNANGPSSSDELDVAGFSHAKRFLLYFREDNEWQGKMDDQTITLDMMLPHVDFDTETLIDSDVLLPSGQTLRINRFSRIKGIAYEYYTLSAWLMTP